MGELLVVGAGPAGWDAGSDLFLDVARRLAGDPSVRFRWVGRRSRGVARWLDHDVTLLGLDGRIEWVAEPDPADPHTVLVVPARTTDARDRALRTCPGAAAVCVLALSGTSPTGSGVAAGPDSVHFTDTVPFPDTVALAARVRVALGDRAGPEEDG